MRLRPPPFDASFFFLAGTSKQPSIHPERQSTPEVNSKKPWTERESRESVESDDESQSRAMQEAALAAMHSELSAQDATRGHHGGLGFDRAVGSQADRASNTQAGKMLLNSGGGNSSKREYHATSAGAVAAGHWDPWSRPVEFHMKEVNRRIGGLYSMFVKGGTEGNTI